MPRTANTISRKKAIETFLEGNNPLTRISEYIEEHTWEVGWDAQAEEFYKYRTANPYDTCTNKRCHLCKAIQAESERIPAYSLGKTLVKPFEELSLGHFGKLASADVTKAQLPKLLNVTMKEINKHIEKLVKDMGLDDSISLLKDYEISDEVIQQLLGIGVYDMRKYKQRMVEGRKARAKDSRKGEWA